MDQGVLVASVPIVETGFVAQAFEDGYSLDIAYLRNPGVTAVVVRTNPSKKPLTAYDRKYFAELAERFGAKIWEGRRIAPIAGPDGKTPIVMPNRSKVSPEDPQQKGVMNTIMSFPTQQQAREASKYVAGEYKLVIRKGDNSWEVEAGITGDLRLAADEWAPFAKVAKCTGGKVVSAGTYAN